MARKRLNAQPLTVAERSARARTKRRAMLAMAEHGGLGQSLSSLRALCPHGIEIGELLLSMTKPRSLEDLQFLIRLLNLLHGDSRRWPASVQAAFEVQRKDVFGDPAEFLADCRNLSGLTARRNGRISADVTN